MTRSRHSVGRPAESSAARRASRIAVAGLAALVWPAVALAAEGGGSGGLIELNWSLVVQLINFLILLAVLFRFVYKPLVATLDARTLAIKQQLAEAQAAREAAQRQLSEFEAKLAAAQAEAQAVRDRALRDAAELRDRLNAEARQEATRLVDAARAEIQQDVRRARGELRAEVVNLAVAIAERLIHKNVQAEDQERLVQDALARLGSR